MPLEVYEIEALELISAADRDEEAAGAIEAARGAFEMVGFHLQQATEKRLKAILILHRQTPPYTHDIERLLEMLENLGLDISSYRTAGILTNFAVMLRYAAGGSNDEAAIALGKTVTRDVLTATVTEVSKRNLMMPGSKPLPSGMNLANVRREDLCPCNSELKFKSCHYGPLRALGKI